MEVVRFACAACGKKIKVDGRFAGRGGKCPDCGEAFVVPSTPDSLSDAPAATSADFATHADQALDQLSQAVNQNRLTSVAATNAGRLPPFPPPPLAASSEYSTPQTIAHAAQKPWYTRRTFVLSALILGSLILLAVVQSIRDRAGRSTPTRTGGKLTSTAKGQHEVGQTKEAPPPITPRSGTAGRIGLGRIEMLRASAKLLQDRTPIVSKTPSGVTVYHWPDTSLNGRGSTNWLKMFDVGGDGNIEGVAIAVKHEGRSRARDQTNAIAGFAVLGQVANAATRKRESVGDTAIRHTGWPFTQAGGGAFNWPVGASTDDSDMSMCLVRSYIDRGRFDPADVATRFVAWMRSSPPDIGGTTRRTLGRIAAGVPWNDGAFEDFRSSPGNAANGSLMRNGVVPALADTLEEAFRFTLQHGLMTHYAPLAQVCCAAQTYLIWATLAGRNPLAGPWQARCRDAWMAWVCDDEDAATRTWLRHCQPLMEQAWQTLAEAEWNPQRFDPFTADFAGRAGYCLLTLQIAVWAAQWSRMDESFPVPSQFPPEPFERRGPWVLGWVAMVGHDSDTYASTAGPLIAAIHGRLPSQMTAGLSTVAEFERLIGNTPA